MNQPIVCRGVRGATTVAANDREEILVESRRLLAMMIRLNGMEASEVASVIFTVTPDLNAEFPALAARCSLSSNSRMIRRAASGSSLWSRY